jgi:hypothetical protein
MVAIYAIVKKITEAARLPAGAKHLPGPEG